MPIKARASTFYRKAQRTAGAIVDLQNLLHVAVGGVARVLPCIFGDGFRIFALQNACWGSPKPFVYCIRRMQAAHLCQMLL